MKQSLFCSIIIALPIIFDAQNFQINPYINGVTSIKDGQIELGPELHFGAADNIQLKPFIRMPLTSKTDNVLQVDRFSSTWRAVLVAQFVIDRTAAVGPIRRHCISFQGEYGSSEYKYYPTGAKSNEKKVTNISYAGEIKWIYFQRNTPANSLQSSIQLSPQGRVRYSYDWKAADQVEVINTPNSNSVVTISSMIIDAPNVKPVFSPAFAFQFYLPQAGDFSFSPAVYYDFTGKKGSSTPFGNLERLRIECWTFYYPLIAGTPGLKIGFSPFASIRTAGTDDFRSAEFGGIVTVKLNSSMLQFF